MALTPNVSQTSYQNVPKQKSEDKHPSLQEREARDYSFKREKTRELFEELLEQNILTLPEIRRPNEVGWTNNPKYCPYHRLISHLVNGCFVLKIQDLIDSGSISLLENSIKAPVNQVSIIEDAL